MKKLVTLLVGLLITVSMVHAQNYWDDYLINQDFDGIQTLPEGWSYISGTTAVFGRAAGISYVDGIRLSGAGGGNRGGEVKFPFTADSTVVYVDLDLLVAKSVVNSRNTFQFYLLGSKSLNVNANDGSAFADAIAGIYWAGASGKFHIWNKDIKGPSPVETPDAIVPVLGTGQYPAFNRASATNLITDSLNLGTKSEVNTAYNEWFNIKYKLNFVTKKLDLTITQISDPLNTETFTDLDFINSDAEDFVSFGLLNNRSTNSGNGGNADLDATIDNLKVYQKVLSLGNANVTIMYQDTDGNSFKASRVAEDQEVGMVYQLLESDLASVIADGFYYAYDPIATGNESVTVEQTGTTIIVKFKKAPLTAGPYNWKGFVSDMWNEQDANFTTDGANTRAYQNGNTVEFSDADAAFKSVVLNKKLELGDGNVIFNAPGYSLNSTSGFLNGTGSVLVNATTSLGFINNLDGPIIVYKDTLTLTNSLTAKKVEMKSGTTLKTTVNFGAPVEGDGGSLTLIPGVVAYTSNVTGVSQINYNMQSRGNYTAFSGTPRMNMVLDSLAKVNVTTIAGDSTLFDTWTNYSKNSIHLGDLVYMTHSLNPNENSSTIMHIGELTGSESSKLVGPKLRLMTYNVGALNTDATFHGAFAPFVRDAWNNMTTYNIVKVGKGTWTIAGNSPDYFGAVRVLDGTLNVDGLLSDMQGQYAFGADSATIVSKYISEVLVADTATLGGSGFLGANIVNVAGTITGNLTIGGTLSLTPDLGEGGATTIINVSATSVDKIKVVGDLNYGGKLIVNVAGSYPLPGDYQIFEFGGYVESGVFGFDSIELPSDNWTFNYETGILNYKGGDDNSVNQVDNNKVIQSIRYYDITGREVTKHHEGVTILKVNYVDGTSTTLKHFIRK